MTALAPTLEAFFCDRLIKQRGAGPNTIAAYRDTFRLLIAYTTSRTNTDPSNLDIGQLDATLIGGFLHHIETERNNSPSTRNARLAAIRSFYRYAAYQHPEHAELIQRVLTIPQKRTDRATVSFLTRPETDALLAAPNTGTWFGRRDRTILVVMTQAGLRVSETTALTIGDVQLDRPGAHINIAHGKGRKQRGIPISATVTDVLRGWLQEHPGQPGDPLFPSRRRTRLSRDAIAHLVVKHAATAAASQPSIAVKNVTPHTLRHTCAMALLHAGVDTTVIALWLGHETIETTQIYIHADMTIKEAALDRTTPPNTSPGRYQPETGTLAFLRNL